MEGGEGMVAVVRGLRDSGLAVTLLDGTRQYTLMPNAVQPPSPTHVHVAQQACARAQTQPAEQPPCSDSAAQATDGRYASMYKMSHCYVTPTSPPVQLTEFPPQRAELCRGHGNFEVGGHGSGENYSPCRSNGSFRGAMSWPDRGSVCSPRSSREPDAFANSLRKYPNIAVERSTEMIERLITYTQAKNVSKSRYSSPSRHESNSSNQLGLDRNISRNTVRTGSYQKSYEPDVNISSKIKPRLEDSPTRDLRTDYDFGDYRRQVMRADNKYSKDISKKARENIRSMSSYPYNQPAVSPVIKERYEQNLSGLKTSSLLTATNSVNMEVQAAAEMVSREVATLPGTIAVQRTVAVPLSPTSSSDDQKPEGDVSDQHHAKLNPNPPVYKSVEIASMPVDLSVQTTSSSLDVDNSMQNCRCFIVQRRNKSNENLHKDFGNEIFELLEKVSVCPNSDPQACDLRREVLKEMSNKLQKMTENIDWNEGAENKRNQIGKLLEYVPIWVPCGDVQTYRDAISDEIIRRMNHYKSCNVYRAETYFDIANKAKSIDDLLNNWIGSIPFKSFDVFGKPVEKKSIRDTISNRIKRLIRNSSNNDGIYSLKQEILNIISKLPIEIDKYTKSDYLNNLTESLLNQLKSKHYLKHGSDKFANEPDSNQTRKCFNNKFIDYIQPTEEEIKECISDEVKRFLERTCSNTNSVNIRDVEIEIIDYLIDSIQAIRSGEDFVESGLTMLLCQEIQHVYWSDAKHMAQKFLKLVKNMFCCNTYNQESMNTNFNQSQAYVVLQNTARSCSHNTLHTNDDLANLSDLNIGAISNHYMNQLTTQIDEWLASLKMQIPQAHDSGFRQVVVHDLAGDIIDRLKYLELNPSSKVSDEDELEHLRYQIFKWINKLAGEDNMDTIEHAPELMQRIRSIPVPMLTKPQQNSTAASICCPQNASNVNPMPKANEGNLNQVQPMTVNKSNQLQAKPVIADSHCSSTHLKPSTPSMKRLNEEYDDFLKKWVQEIPMPSSTEKGIAEKARLGIYNGVWKAITKLKFEPATFNNLFYYEDALDDELEELLNVLPTSSELETKKHLLKVQLIERTTKTNELIKSTAAPASFRQQLVENVLNSLPSNIADKEDLKQSLEELKVLRIVDDYILCTNYKDIDKIKANFYRKKLIQETQTLIDNLKKTYGKQLQDIDTDLYINSIFNALHKVCLPNDDTVKDEAEEIMLGAEVEQWFLDLPVISNNNGNEQLQKKRMKDALVMRIRELEKEVNIFDCTGQRVLKHEISSFLEKVPIQQGESMNITFMAEEFVNRLKNRAKELQADNGARKSVAFMDSVGYYEFSQHMPQCSSFSESPGARPAVANQSSYMIRDGAKVEDPYGYNYYAEASLPPHVPLPSEEYFTLEDSQAPPKPKQPQMQPQPVQEENQYSRMQSYKSIPPVTLHQTTEPSAVPIVHSHSETVRDKTVPTSESPEKQQNPCCRSAVDSPVRQQTINGLNQSGQVPRVSIRMDHSSPETRPVPLTDIPPQARSPCSVRNQSNASKNVSPTLQRAGTPIRKSIINPGDAIDVGQAPQISHRSPVQITLAQSGSIGAAEQIQQPVEQIREISQQRDIPCPISAIGEPQGYSTPQQIITQGSAPRPGRKKARNSQRSRKNLERRRLELEDDTEGFESEVDEPCHCMEIMIRRRRPPVCFAYEDLMDQCYPFQYGSLPFVTNNFTVQLCGDVRMESKSKNQESNQRNADSFRNIKSVQTSFSSVDLVPAEKCCNCHRKIKSQEDLRNKDKDIQLQNEVLDWLKATYNSGATTEWGEKMHRLAQKLTKPGGEEKIRQKIQRYLKRVPSQFSECDEERRLFREQMPENIIKKLKKLYLKPERRRDCSSPVRIFRIEIPKGYCNIENKFKDVVKNWLKEIPIKKRDFLGRLITKEDVLDYVVIQLEPYILNRKNFDKDYRSILQARIKDILNEMPIEMNGFDKISYNQLGLSLLNNIIHVNDIEYYTETSNTEAYENSEHESELKDFVSNQIANILNKLHLSASTKRLKLLEEELNDTLVEVMYSKECNHSEATKDNIFTILHKLGGLSDYQANYFTDVILKHFKEDFGEIPQERKKTRDLGDTSSPIDRVPYIDTYTVLHNTAKITTDLSNKRPVNIDGKNVTINDEIKSSLVFFKRRLIVQIEDWLNELQLKTHFENKDKAVKDLAEDIIDRLKYLELNPASKGPDVNELQYLKYQIFKWINKVAGENTMETIDHANELMNRIQNIDALTSVKFKEEKCKIPILSQIKSSKDRERYFQLSQVVTDCLNNIPNAFKDTSNVTELVDDLASSIIKQIELDTNTDTVINKEVNRWMKNVYRGKHKWIVKDKLKRSLKDTLRPKHHLENDPKREKNIVRKFEDIIDDWIDDLIKTSKEELRLRSRNQNIHDLAIQFFNLINNEESHPNKCLEEVILKWAETCLGQGVIPHNSVSKLVDLILNFNNEILSNRNPEDYEKAYNTFLFEIQNQTNLISTYKQNEEIVRIDNNLAPSDIAVFGVTLPSNSRAENTNFGDSSIKAVNNDDVQASLDLYLKQLVEQIDDWLSTLNIPQIHDTGFREIVVNDLAGDIIDRHKYLELNPSSRGSDESELKQLKYQIFKWINKLVGENQQETVEHASDLMNRIRNIPVPMLTKYSDTYVSKSNRVTNCEPTKANTSAIPSNVRLSSPLGFTTGPMATTNKQNVVQMPLLGAQVPRGSLSTNGNANVKGKRLSGPPALGIPKTPTQRLQTQSEEEQENLPQGMSLEELHEYFDKIFQELVKEIPLDTPNPEQELLAELARKGIYNGIWKTYFQLKADPEIENDYSYFEMVFEDELNKMLDCLPQTNDMQKIRQVWKIKVLSNVLNMLKYVHSMTDSPSFRQLIAKKFNRQFLRGRYMKGSNLIQQQYVDTIAKAYILQSKYKEEDPVKANIYRQRLMKKVGELAEAVKSQNNVEFRCINQAQLAQMAMQLLKSVPIPHDETLTEEAEEILVSEEIDQWYNGLPVKPVCNETDENLRKRMRELLAKRLCAIEKHIDLDELAEQNLRHEVSQFLQEKAELQKNVDLEINFMVEELLNRLKNRRQQNMLGYESFEKEKPVSSTFVQTDPGEVLAPLVDTGINAEEPSSLELPEVGALRNLTNQPQIMQGQGILGTSQLASPSNQGYYRHSVGQMPATCCQGQGNLGTSQIARPSSQVPFQEQLGQTSLSCHQGQGISDTSQAPGPNSQIPYQEQISRTPLPCYQGQGILGTSQVAGPSSHVPIQQQIGQALPPCCQGQDNLRTGEIPSTNVQGPYQQPIDQSQPYREGQPMAGPRQSFAPIERFGNQTCHDRRPSRAPERSRMLPNLAPCAPNHPSTQIDSADQIFPGPSGQTASPSTEFLRTQNPTPAADSRSTARVTNSPPDQELLDEETDGEEEIRYKCNCMERVWKCKKRHYYEDIGRNPRCYPMPFPCRYFY